ncbi:winged helix-turn-helix transcriptional regulator [Agromyces larvae]|uniref:Helix-turn-helix transcriptional regulator n=1 Tax=Agromyces larvae TaxID=2929802 RepID=A0ABY4BZH0_9MICO|nr:helix-turn-helix domain-containing protein [Agromyces larvae]UOE44144.1 helix-turn-helix transcriptional regulator [Agromyces larvae]
MEACPTGQHHSHNVYEAECPCRSLLELLANKWTALAIGALEAGPMRFGALKNLLSGVSPKMLAQTLRRLEDSDLVTRTVYPAVPAHVEYELTDLGRSVAEPLRGLRVWVERHLDDVIGFDRARDLSLLEE